MTKITLCRRKYYGIQQTPTAGKNGSVANLTPMTSSRSRRLLLLFAGALLLFTVGLHLPGLWDFDEGFYAQISLEMLQSGDFVYTTFNGGPRFDKPPLLYWMIAFFYSVFGVNEWAVRLPSALMGALAVVVTAMLGERFSKGWTLSLLGGVILATAIPFFILARMGMMDVGLTLFVSLAIYSYTRTWTDGKLHDGNGSDWKGPSGKSSHGKGSAGRSSRSNSPDADPKRLEAKTHTRSWPGWLGVGLFTGLGILMKGPVAFILVGLTLFLFLIVEGRVAGLWRTLRTAGPWLAIGATLLVAAPWHILITMRAGGAFWDRYFGFHQVGLYTSEFQEHGGPWYYHLLILTFGFVPWSAIIPWAKGRLFTPWSGTDHRMHRLLWVWLGGTLLFFSASATKAPAYMLPAFPAMALLLARLWLRWVEGSAKSARESEAPPQRASAAHRSRKRPVRFASPSLITALLAALLVVGVYLVKDSAPPGYEGVADILLWTPASLLVLSVLAIAWGFRRAQDRTLHLWAAAANALVLAVVLAVALAPALDIIKPQRTLAPLAADLSSQLGVPFGSVLGRGGDASTRLYAGLPVTFLDNVEQAAAFLSQPERPLLLALEADLPALAELTAVEIIAEAENGVLLRSRENPAPPAGDGRTP